MIEVTENTVIVTLSNVGPQGPSGIGVQYKQGDIEPNPIGNAILWSDEGNVLKAVSENTPLPVNVVASDIVTVGDVTVSNGPGSSAVNIQDGGNSITVDDGGSSLTVDGTVTIQDGGNSITVDNSGTFAVQASQSGTWTLGANSGVDIGDVTINNGAGASAVNIQDGGNSITVDNDGTFAVQAEQSGTWNINNISGTISLPTGAATEAKQPAFGTAGSASSDVLTVQGIASMTPLLVDGSGVTQPVSGTVTIQDGGNSITVDNAGTFAVQATQSGTWNINNVSGTVSLPENAATETTLSDVKTATESIKTAVEGVLDVNLTSGGVSASILDLASNNPLAVAIVDSTGEQITSFGGGTQYVDGSTAATPTGTVAMWQDSNDDSILAVSDTNPLPVNVIAGDIDVTVGDVTVSNGPGSSAVNIQDGGNSITVDDGGSSLTVDGTVTIQDGGNSITVDNGGTFAVQAAQSGTWNINNISGTISLPTGAATEAKQPAFGTAGSASSDVLTVQGIASMTPLLVDGSGVTQPVSGTVTVQDGGNSITVDGTVAATQSGTWNINNISGTISLPTGAATEAKQPAFGTAGSASSDVLTVQGIASMTPLLVDGSGVTQPVSGTVTIQDGGNSITVDNNGTFAVQATQSGTWTLGENSGTDIGDVTINNGAGASAVNIQDGGNSITVDDGGNSITVDNNGTFAVQATQSGSWNVGQSGTWTVQPGNTANTTPWLMTLAVNTAGAAGGATVGKVISTASTNATSIKTSAGKLYMLTATNINASPCYVKLYNKASSPTVGTDVPVATFLVPGNTSGSGTNIPIPATGLAFSSGIALAITTGAADNNSDAVAAGEVIVNFAYN